MSEFPACISFCAFVHIEDLLVDIGITILLLVLPYYEISMLHLEISAGIETI